MKRLTLLPIAALVLTAACADTPTALQSGGPLLGSDPPPPPVTGRGTVSLGIAGGGERIGSVVVNLSEVSVLSTCEPSPVLAFSVDGSYFQNKPGNNAWIHFFAEDGSGHGNIHETKNKQDASGTLTVTDATVEHHVHFLTYTGATLFQSPQSGFISGVLEAEVTACGSKFSYSGNISFDWGESED